MSAVFIIFDQAHFHNILTILDNLSCRGFTYWPDVQGRGSRTGEPHYGSHAWPTMNSSILTVVPDGKVTILLSRLKELDDNSPRLGLRAFAIPVTDAI